MTVEMPVYLAALPMLAGLGVWIFRRQARMARRLNGLSRHAQGRAAWARTQWGLILAGLAFGAVALAGPRWGRATEEVAFRTRNLMLAVDVSRSMLAEDVRPNRLERAKADLIDLVDALKGDRAGVLAFRGKGVLLCPMTTDAAFLRQSIAALSPESAPPGETDLADAIAKCLAAFEQAGSTHQAIVLVSDGEDLAGRAEALARQAGEAGVPIFTVGIGSVGGATIPDGAAELKHAGETVRSCLTEATLERIAELSGGRYVPLATAGMAETTLGAVYARYLARLADQDARERIELGQVDRTMPFALLAAVCVLAAGVLSCGRIGWRARGMRGVAVWGVLAMGLWSGWLEAQEPAREGQRAYREGRYLEAAEAYGRARQGAEASEVAHYAYNEALAWRKAGVSTNALARVRLATADAALAAQASTLEGTLLLEQAGAATNAVQRLALREEAAGAFARALQAEATEGARRNLARAVEGMEALRYEARRERALEAAKERPLGQQIPALLQHQRALAKAVPEVFAAGEPEVKLLQAERLAEDVRAQADRWFPILEALPQVVTNETRRVELEQQVREAQAALDGAAAQYEEVRGDARALVEGEPFVYEFWKNFADPPALNGESIAVQTNALTSLMPYQPAREDEAEVLALTQQFRLLFPQWAEEQLQQQAASTNAVAFTEADRDLIARTADAMVPLLAPPVSEEKKRQVMEMLLLIREHLPKQQNGEQPQAQPQASQEPQEGQEEASQQPQTPEETEQQAQKTAAEKQEKAKQEDLQALLQKAADRNREHEKEKAKRVRAAVDPNARDW